MLVNLNPSNVAVNVAEDIRSSDTATAVNVTATPGVPLAANPLRVAYSIYNVGPQTVFVRENSTVTAVLYKHPIPPGYLFESDSTSRYTGPVAVVTATGTSNIMVTESSIAT
jgi:hypothetical protein